jgi:hypothetical protein
MSGAACDGPKVQRRPGIELKGERLYAKKFRLEPLMACIGHFKADLPLSNHCSK